MHGSYSELSFERNSEIINHKKNWNIYFSPLPLVLDAYIMPNTNRKMVFLSFWKVNQFNMIYNTRDMETFEISSYKVSSPPPPPRKKKLPVVWGVQISHNICSKCILLVILRSQLTYLSKSCLAASFKLKPLFCDYWFGRYGFWAILGLLGPILAQQIGFEHSCYLGVCKNWTITPLPRLIYKIKNKHLKTEAYLSRRKTGKIIQVTQFSITRLKKLLRINFKIRTYDHFQNILRFFYVLPDFPLTTSEAKRDY